MKECLVPSVQPTKDDVKDKSMIKAQYGMCRGDNLNAAQNQLPLNPFARKDSLTESRATIYDRCKEG